MTEKKELPQEIHYFIAYFNRLESPLAGTKEIERLDKVATAFINLITEEQFQPSIVPACQEIKHPELAISIAMNVFGDLICSGYTNVTHLRSIARWINERLQTFDAWHPCTGRVLFIQGLIHLQSTETEKETLYLKQTIKALPHMDMCLGLLDLASFLGVEELTEEGLTLLQQFVDQDLVIQTSRSNASGVKI
jgi:hypothetical protein